MGTMLYTSSSSHLAISLLQTQVLAPATASPSYLSAANIVAQQDIARVTWLFELCTAITTAIVREPQESKAACKGQDCAIASDALRHKLLMLRSWRQRNR